MYSDIQKINKHFNKNFKLDQNNYLMNEKNSEKLSKWQIFKHLF